MALVLMTTVRITDLLGRLALAAIQWEAASKDLPGLPVIVVAGPRIGKKAVNAAEEFVSEHMPNLDWGLVDGQGTVRIRARALGLDVSEFTVPVRTASSVRHNKILFSDLNRWMLKILLLREAPPEMWGGPREKPGTPTDLHRIARVSTETAHRFVRTFEEQDLLRRTRKGLKLVRIEALLETWMAAARLGPPERIPASWLMNKELRLEDVFPSKDEAPVLVGGFEACRRYGLLHTDSPTLEVHVGGNWRSEVNDWGIEFSDAAQADVILLDSTYPRSIVGGAVPDDDLPRVDIIQAGLDVIHAPSRGLEQAQLIMENVLSCLPKDDR